MIFDQRSVSHPLGELKGWGQNSIFSEHGHAAYQVKENLQVLLYSKYSKSPPTRMGSVGQNSTFSEHAHVAYQIKGKHSMQ